MAGILGRALADSQQPPATAAIEQAPPAPALTDLDQERTLLLRDNNVPDPIQTKLKGKQIFTVKALGFIGGGVQSVALTMLAKALSIEDTDLAGYSSMAAAWTVASEKLRNPSPQTNDLENSFLPEAEFERGKARFRKENGGALPPPEHYLDPRTWGRLYNQFGGGVFKLWPHRRIITRADVDGVHVLSDPLKKETYPRSDQLEEVLVDRTANVIDRETALLYGYVFLGVVHKPTADNHIRKLVQLARDPERHQLTAIVNVVTRVRSRWQSRVMDDGASVESAIQESNARDDLWIVKSADKAGDYIKDQNQGYRGTQKDGGNKGKHFSKGKGKYQSKGQGNKRKFDDQWGQKAAWSDNSNTWKGQHGRHY